MEKTILFGKRVKKTASNPQGWNTIYDGEREQPKLSEDTLLTEKSVIVLPGDGAVSERAVNGCCKSVHLMLVASGIPPEQMPHVYGLGYLSAYQIEHRKQVLSELKQDQLFFKTPEKLTEEQNYWKPFYNEYIQPLIRDENGHPYPVSQVEKNLQNVTFVSHCHGGFVAYQVEKMLSEELSEIYPKEAKKLMGSVRMMHFSSRRPIGHSFGAKHFDIISQYDDAYADTSLLEYDNILKQINRAPLQGPSALIPISDKEEILLLERIADFSEDGPDSDDHNAIMPIFADDLKDYALPQNRLAIMATQELLRHFVEHPEDKRGVNDIMEDLSPQFTAENVLRGENLLSGEKENEEFNRKTLSLLAHPIATINIDKNSVKENIHNTFLRERDSNGRFLYDNLVEQYQKTGNSRPLAQYIKAISCLFIPREKMLSLIGTTVEKKDWKFFDTIFRTSGNKLRFGYFPKTPLLDKQLSQIISSTEADDLHHLLPFLEVKECKDILAKNPKMLNQLIGKIGKVKKVLHKESLLSFVNKTFPDAQTQQIQKHMASFLVKQSCK